MNARQQYALAHPLSDAGADLAPYRTQKRHPTGMWVVSILAVDR